MPPVSLPLFNRGHGDMRVVCVSVCVYYVLFPLACQTLTKHWELDHTVSTLKSVWKWACACLLPCKCVCTSLKRRRPDTHLDYMGLPSKYKYMRTLNSTLSDYSCPAFKPPKCFRKTAAQWISTLLYLSLSFS